MASISDFASRRETVSRAPDETIVPLAPPLSVGGLRGFGTKVSSRLSRHVALSRRRLANVRPMVSLTFDDIAASAADRGADIVEEFGGRSTFYISTSLIGKRTELYEIAGAEALADLSRRNHELGLHFHDHVRADQLDDQDLQHQIQSNRDALRTVCPGAAGANFAYPFGYATFGAKRSLRRTTSSCRSITPGVQSGWFDPHHLRCVELTEARLEMKRFIALLDETSRVNGWLIFLTHDITDRPTEFGCRPAFFRRALEEIAARRMDMVTVETALQRSTSLFAVEAPQ